jgi:hypothetical protein
VVTKIDCVGRRYREYSTVNRESLGSPWPAANDASKMEHIMSMKSADIDKHKMLKSMGTMKGEVRNRNAQATAPVDRREQRKSDQAAGLVPFACKLPLELVNTLRDAAATRAVGLNELVAQLLHKGLA